MAFPPRFLDELRSRLACSRGDRPARAAGPQAAASIPASARSTTRRRRPSRQRGQGLLPLLRLRRAWRCRSASSCASTTCRFLEAVERLAGEAGLECRGRRRRSARGRERQKTLLDVVEAACAWLRGAAAGRRPAAPAWIICERRGLDDATIRAFRLGCAPDGRAALRPRCSRKAIPGRRCCCEAGLIVRARGRPRQPSISSAAGSCSRSATGAAGSIAFGGRVHGRRRSRNTSIRRDTPLFDKGRTLYGLDKARAAACASGRRAGRRRRLYGRDRAARGRLRRRGGAARHRADRGADRGAVALAPEPVALLRRRRRRPARGAAGRRARPAAAAAGPQPALCHAARRARTRTA